MELKSKSPAQLAWDNEIERIKDIAKTSGYEGGIYSLFSNKGWMAANRVRLGFMVSQLGTTIRNVGSVTGEVYCNG